MDAVIEAIPVSGGRASVERSIAPRAPGAPVDQGAMAASDLEQILGAFNEVTGKLQAAHESLRSEVVRLRGELRQANEQIERGKRLAALGEMAAGIAHEVRNPLGSIRLYAGMLVQDLAGAERARERGIAEKIGAATRGLDAVVTDVLAFAREVRLNAAGVEAGSLLGRAVEECLAADRAGGGSVDEPVRVVREDAATGMDCEMVWCDGALLHRALVNVVRNAVQAMRDHGGSRAAPELRVGVERRSLPSASGAAEAFVALVVRDNGPGIPRGVMERMFNPFFTTRATGTGLGLAIVHRTMDAHGGRVLVRNVEGAGGAVEGAAVELLLPASAGEGASIAAGNEPRFEGTTTGSQRADMGAMA